MESGPVLRMLLLLALFLFLTGDYTALLKQVYQSVLGNQTTEANSGKATSGSDATPPKRHKPRGFGDDKPILDFEADIETDESLQMFGTFTSKLKLLTTIKNACLPKLICELNATSQKEKLTESEKSLLSLIKETSISTTAEITSKYHFAAHMGQLISGVDGTGCHNFYPTCPFPSLQVLQMMKKVKMR